MTKTFAQKADRTPTDKKRLQGRRRRELTKHDYPRINLGRAFRDASIGSIRDKDARKVLIRYCENIVDMVKTGSGLVFTGGLGVGKTWAASAVLKEAVRWGFTGYFVTQPELRELQFNDKVFGDGTDGVTVNHKLGKFDVLVIDDLNEPFLSDKAFGPLQLERLVSQRNTGKLATIITTRVATELANKSDFANLFDIVSATMVPVGIEGPNLRDRARQELAARVLGEGKT